MNNKDDLIYLAAPYSHKDNNVIEERVKIINKVASILMSKGLYIFSPISHTHPIALSGDLPKGWEFWENYDRLMIKRCQLLYVLKIDGWKESTGVNAEIKIANELGIPIRYVNFDGYLINISNE